MFKNKTSLIIVCVFIGILICHFTMCGCKTNYSLIEGMTATAPTGNPLSDAVSKAKSMTASSSSTASATSAAPAAPAAPAPATPASSTTAAGGAKKATAIAKPSPAATAPAAATAAATSGTEGFQQQGRPLDYGSLQESKSDDWTLSKWVKDAMRYSKGMGNENRLDNYQYNSGPQIPLPEGEMFFFKDTKFSSQCCPGTYSSSLGCACLSKPQVNYLTTRAGNHTIPTGRKTSYINEY
jgi:hypothetical protein